ncbi:hypothetical protein BU24DRAFT_278246 [Aaosphaeria arxii CBS 175.79]|uniref:Uncharacterized protein n=1 Tax=Aaosphaeria arxii CBS 175.79 TaxID=1450172 RepID=A0A6A5XEN8_9PLEO|nr:uncharacterized protein BU24DRAFT_278246 [Aaosphaeria arxii CBS 175.79]KAF2011306.1 hypothetical protein BU24DRAFT_278246 [Aaosphaeria arxii CBS 175.79]
MPQLLYPRSKEPATPRQTIIIAACFGVAIFLILLLAFWYHGCLGKCSRKGSRRGKGKGQGKYSKMDAVEGGLAGAGMGYEVYNGVTSGGGGGGGNSYSLGGGGVVGGGSGGGSGGGLGGGAGSGGGGGDGGIGGSDCVVM